jgi:hypothetical protein
MKKFIAISLIVTGLLAAGSVANRPATAIKPQARFYCGQSYNTTTKKSVPTTFVATSAKSEPIALIRWKSALGEYTPQIRCDTVSQKFQSAWQSGKLRYVVAGTDPASRAGIICGLADKSQKCDRSTMLFTLRSRKDAGAVVTEIDSIRRGTTSAPLDESAGTEIADLEELLK